MDLGRRTFFSCVGGLGIAAALPREKPFLLSKQGCGRATGYAEANKIVTVGKKTHVAWLDSPPEGFRVRVRTLDRETGKWSATKTVGEAADNHGGPALTVDGKGFLHIVYHPHHHPFRYRRSSRPNDASEWEEEVRFGERCTYPTMLCGPDGTLYLTCRRSFRDRPWQMELWTKPTGGAWSGPVVVARARYKGYAHFQESLAWGKGGRLHLFCRFHEKTDRGGYGRIQTVGAMQSDDLGKTWRRSDGGLIEGPATAETVDVLAEGGVDRGRGLRAGGMAVDPEGTPCLVYSETEGGRGRTILARPRRKGGWDRTELNRHLPKEWKDRQLVMPGGLTFDRRGRMVIAATLKAVGEGEKSWGHPSNEVVRLESSDGGARFSFRMISSPDARTPHWLPNIERPTGHHRVPEKPGILYTSGPRGAKNTDLLSNRVNWAT